MIWQGAWQPSLNISTVLTSIGLLLNEPNPDDGLMHEAVSNIVVIISDFPAASMPS